MQTNELPRFKPEPGVEYALCFGCGAITIRGTPCQECGGTKQIPVSHEYARSCRDYQVVDLNRNGRD